MNAHDAALDLAAVALDFRLDARERAALDTHLAGCPACRAGAERFRGDAAAIRALRAPALSQPRADAILARVLAQPHRAPEALRLVFVAALLALLAISAVVVGGQLLRRSLDDMSVVPPMPSDTAKPSPIAADRWAGPWGDSGVGTAWVRVAIPDTEIRAPGGGIMSGVIAGGPGAIAWGQVYAAGPRIWTTTDGSSWTPAVVEAPPDPDPEFENPGIVEDVAVGGPGYVACGFYAHLGTGHRGVIWTSVDGVTWSLLPYSDVFEHTIPYTIIPWGGRLLAFGTESWGPSGGGTPSIAWSSTDGVSWIRESLSLPTGKNLGQVEAVDGRLWAIAGNLGDDVGPQELQMVSSFDGLTWELSSLGFAPGTLHSVGGALVAVVRPEPRMSAMGPGVYRVTTDGTWTTVSTDGSTVGYDIVEVGGTLVMVGDNANGNTGCWGRCQAMGSRSIDGGATWESIAADVAGGTMTNVAALPDGTLVAVGAVVGSGGWPSLAGWVSRPSR